MSEIKRFESSILSSNMYLIIEGTRAIVIDPYDDTSVAAGLTIDYILLTHEHYDHISGVKAWKARTNATVICSKACSTRISNPKENLARYFRDYCELQTWVEVNAFPEYDRQYTCYADETFENEMTIMWQGHDLKLFEIPGHSPGSIGILLDRSCFFSGDSLMENYEIELHAPGGSRKQWEQISKPRLLSIPRGVIVYPGHFREFVYHGDLVKGVKK